MRLIYKIITNDYVFNMHLNSFYGNEIFSTYNFYTNL